MIGRIISHYRITEKVGEGGMGVVYKAEDTRLGRSVALKFLRPDALENEEHKARFVNEARAVAALDHPNICTVYEIDEDDGQLFIAMAFIEGHSLGERIASKSLPPAEALDIARQIALGARESHREGIVHRDIKSSNVMVTERSDGELRVKLMDFGVAYLARVKTLTKEGTTLGTVAYMSPEQARGQKVDQRTDIWALGVVLYEMLTGRLPFRADHEQAVLHSIKHENPEPVSGLVSGLSSEVDKLLERCLAKDPDKRYPGMQELLDDIRAQAGKQESAATLQVTRQAPVSPDRHMAKRVAPAVFALALAALAGAWFSGLIGPSAPPPEPSLRVVPLTSYAGAEEQPSFSPDGNQVTFSWNGDKQDNFDIYVKLTGPGPSLRLTTAPAGDRSPAWSPDGRQIAFLRETSPGVAEVLLIPPIGGPERRLAELRIPPSRDAASAYFGTTIDWSPDGKHLAVPDQDSSDQRPGIFLLSVETGRKQRLTAPPGQAIDDREPAFSPDGATVAFERYSASSVTHVFSVPVAGGEPTQLSFISGEPRGLAWTADGGEIVFSRPDGLARISASGGEARRLVGTETNAGEPVVSGPARRLAYSRRERDIDIWRLASWAGEEDAPTRLISSTRPDSGPQFSPDGRQIVFWSSRSGTPEIWVSDDDGANALPLTSFAGPHTGTPRWSPDNRNIVFDSRVGDNPEVFVVNASVGSLRRITEMPSEDVVASWSRDGRWIYFASNRGGEMQVWKTPFPGDPAHAGAAVQVTRHGGFAAFESPDGRFVYYAKNRSVENAIWKIPAGGGEETPVIEHVPSGWGHWAVVNQGIYFVDRVAISSAETRWDVKFFDFDSREVSRVGGLRHRPPIEDAGFAVSPDGRWILCAQEETSADLMLVENFQ